MILSLPVWFINIDLFVSFILFGYKFLGNTFLQSTMRTHYGDKAFQMCKASVTDRPIQIIGACVPLCVNLCVCMCVYVCACVWGGGASCQALQSVVFLVPQSLQQVQLPERRSLLPHVPAPLTRPPPGHEEQDEVQRSHIHSERKRCGRWWWMSCERVQRRTWSFMDVISSQNAKQWNELLH